MARLSRTIASAVYPASPPDHVLLFPTSTTRRSSRVLVKFLRESWPNVPDLLTARIERLPVGQPDVPANWILIAGGGAAPGGTLLNEDGSVKQYSSIEASSKNPDGSPAPFEGDLRLRVTLAQSLRTTVEIEAEEVA